MIVRLESPTDRLASVEVERAAFGQPLESTIVEAVRDEAGRRGESAVILLGDPSYYGPLGFVPASRYGLLNPFAGVQEEGFVVAEEDFQIAVLDEARATRLTGEVRWHPAFG